MLRRSVHSSSTSLPSARQRTWKSEEEESRVSRKNKMAGSRTTNTLKSALVVVGAIAFGWLSIELAFKPFLNRAREALDKADPTRDPDAEDGVAPKPSNNSSETSSDGE